MSTPNRNLLLRLFPLLALLIFVACGSDPVDPIVGPNAEISGIPDTVTQGETITLSGVNSTAGEEGTTITAYDWVLAAPSGATEEGESQEFTFTLEETGEYTVTLTVTDSQGEQDSDERTFAVEAAGTGENNPPVALDDTETTEQDTAVTIDVLENDTDADADDTLTITNVTDPANGTAVDNDDGTITYTPDAGFTGTDTFEYTVSDGTDTGTATVTVSVNEPTGANTAPDAVDDTAAAESGIATEVDVLANDLDAEGDAEITSVTQPANGTVVINDNGTADDASDDTVTYTSNVGFTGDDTFTYTLSDGEFEDTATVTVNVSTPGTFIKEEAIGAYVFVNGYEVVSDGYTRPREDFDWTLVGKPVGSETVLLETNNYPIPQFIPDVKGNYTVEERNTGERFTYTAVPDTEDPVINEFGISDDKSGPYTYPGGRITLEDTAFELLADLSDDLGIDSYDGGLTLQLRSAPDSANPTITDYWQIGREDCVDAEGNNVIARTFNPDTDLGNGVADETDDSLGFRFLPNDVRCTFILAAVGSAPPGEYSFRIVARDGVQKRARSGEITVIVPAS